MTVLLEIHPWLLIMQSDHDSVEFARFPPGCKLSLPHISGALDSLPEALVKPRPSRYVFHWSYWDLLSTIMDSFFSTSSLADLDGEPRALSFHQGQLSDDGIRSRDRPTQANCMDCDGHSMRHSLLPCSASIRTPLKMKPRLPRKQPNNSSLDDIRRPNLNAQLPPPNPQPPLLHSPGRSAIRWRKPLMWSICSGTLNQ